MQFDMPAHRIIGPAGELPVLPDDLVVSRLAMLIEGQCEGIGAAKAAEKFGLSKQRYFQLLKLYREQGSLGLLGHKPGPNRNYVRTDEVVRQIIRHRFLDPTQPSTSSHRSFAKPVSQLALAVSSASSKSTAFKKKLYRYRPKPEPLLETQTTKTRTKPMPCDPRSIERGVRQSLADKVTGNLTGVWLLAPELLRLGAWDLLRDWTGQRPEDVQPRLALQLIHEAALCITGLRLRRGLNQHVFELANGLPFLATDMAVHGLPRGSYRILDSQACKWPWASCVVPRAIFGDRFSPSILIASAASAAANMRRHRSEQALRPTNTAQTFFVLDADTSQPVCFTTGTSARTASNAAE